MISLKNVSYCYPFSSRRALNNVNLEVKPGEVVLCTGVSGCGKSTLIRLINGLCPHFFGGTLEGTVSVNGIDNRNREIFEISSDVGTLFQEPENQFFSLGVEDEMSFALQVKGCCQEEIKRRVLERSRNYGIERVLSSSIHELSQGQKQKLGLASISMEPVKCLILDEPTANLDPESTMELAEEIKKLRAQGTAIVVVDHRLYWLNGVADRVLVFQEGEIKEECKLEDLGPEKLNQYGLRKTVVSDPRKKLEEVQCEPEKGLLGFKNLTFTYKKDIEPIFHNVSLGLPPGIIALIGDNGVGKTTLARILTGLNKAKQGEFFSKGRKEPQSQLLKKVAIVLQNADYQLHMKTVFKEVIVSLEASGCKGGQEAAMQLLEMFNLQDLKDRHPQSLSGGQKQRLVIACAFAKNPEVIILDEPTSGLDGLNMKRIADGLHMLAEKGKSIIVITHDLELMESCCRQAIRLPLTEKENHE